MTVNLLNRHRFSQYTNIRLQPTLFTLFSLFYTGYGQDYHIGTTRVSTSAMSKNGTGGTETPKASRGGGRKILISRLFFASKNVYAAIFAKFITFSYLEKRYSND